MKGNKIKVYFSGQQKKPNIFIYFNNIGNKFCEGKKLQIKLNAWDGELILKRHKK